MREPEQAERVFDIISPYQDIFTGFIFPKYTVANAAVYKANAASYAKELLDLDAMTGGFNLQIAWSTGFLAGKSAAES